MFVLCCLSCVVRDRGDGVAGRLARQTYGGLAFCGGESKKCFGYGLLSDRVS